ARSGGLRVDHQERAHGRTVSEPDHRRGLSPRDLRRGLTLVEPEPARSHRLGPGGAVPNPNGRRRTPPVRTGACLPAPSRVSDVSEANLPNPVTLRIAVWLLAAEAAALGVLALLLLISD